MGEGYAPQAKEISARLELPLKDVAESLRELEDEDVIAFLPRTEELRLAHPFCASRAPFEVLTERRNWDAICIWDALGIVVLVDSDGDVSTVCPDCRQPIQISVVDGDVNAPVGALVHFGVTVRHWYEDVGYIRANMRLFRSGDDLQQCLEQGNPRGETMSVERLWNLSRAWYGDRHLPTWKRQSPAEAESLFRSYGLVSDFWSFGWFFR